jgi:hypothetical protein
VCVCVCVCTSMTSSLSKAQHEWMVKPGDSGTVMVPRGTSPSTVGVVSEEEYKCRKRVEIMKRKRREKYKEEENRKHVKKKKKKEEEKAGEGRGEVGEEIE